MKGENREDFKLGKKAHRAQVLDSSDGIRGADRTDLYLSNEVLRVHIDGVSPSVDEGGLEGVDGNTRPDLQLSNKVYNILIEGGMPEGGSSDLTEIENAVTRRGGTVDKEDVLATIQELATAVLKIPETDLSDIADTIVANGGTVGKRGSLHTPSEIILGLATIPKDTDCPEPVDLAPVELAITNKGGTVTKAGEKPTVQEIVIGISTIPKEKEDTEIPLPDVPPAEPGTVVFPSFAITDSVQIENLEVEV